MKRSRIVFIIAALLCLSAASYAWDTAFIGFDVENQTMYTVVRGDYQIHCTVTYTQTNTGGFIFPGGQDYTAPTEMWAAAALSPVDRSRMTDVPPGQTNTIRAYITYWDGENPVEIDSVDDVLVSNGSTYTYNNGDCNPPPSLPDTIRIGSSFCAWICHGSYTIPIYCEGPGYNPNLLQVYVDNGCSHLETTCDDPLCPKINWNAFSWRKLITPPCRLRMTMVYCNDQQPGCICIHRSDYRLPVEMQAFTAYAGDSRIALSWATASESALQSFKILRSTSRDGVYGAVYTAPASNSATGHHYNWVDTDVRNDMTYYYQLAVVDINGSHSYNNGSEVIIVSATPHGGAVADEYSVAQNYPNPFNSRTIFEFTLADAGKTTLRVYDLLGREMATVVNDFMTAGKHQVNWSADGLPTGVYMYTLSSGTFTQTRKLLYLK